ncbi:TRADD-N-associated membrane domain-containing protein [Shewanella carassii]|uniref:Cyanobacterial TRADD-N associated 2 transmembrane domain-containing protein n=1 Tax=Shewanella carassii TaxID=1987584 RepID=A0ABQ1TG11_9GAMM|nr:hypothetical protein GCM10011520_38720 [Shewanella carassii]
MSGNEEIMEKNEEKQEKDGLLANIDEKISKLQVRLDHKESRAADVLLGLVIVLCIVFAFIGNDLLKGTGIVADDFKYAPFVGVALTFYFGFFFAFLSTRRNVRRRQLVEELESLKAKRNTIRPLQDSESVTYFDRLVDININNLSDYYSMVKEHTDKSFFASIFAGGIGFLLIVTGLLIGFTDLNNSQSIAYISSGSGVIIEFISGVFFWLYSKTTQQLKGYHDSLVNIQNVLLSFKVIEDTKDDATKLEMAKTMITSLNSTKNA